MADERWNLLDDYLAGELLPTDAALDGAVRAGMDAGMPQIQVSPTQGKMLYLLARMVGARRILEIGTLAGYSTIWLARALPADGRVVTLELAPEHARVAESNFRNARLEAKIEIRVGRATDSLAVLIAEGAAPFDLVFVDADKERNSEYVEMALRLSHTGTIIVVDNIARQGAVLDADSDDPAVQGIRRMMHFIGAEPRLEATAIQTVGVKGYDGFALLRVTE
jgi:predicted O-methyltransferase YrrM